MSDAAPAALPSELASPCHPRLATSASDKATVVEAKSSSPRSITPNRPSSVPVTVIGPVTVPPPQTAASSIQVSVKVWSAGISTGRVIGGMYSDTTHCGKISTPPPATSGRPRCVRSMFSRAATSQRYSRELRMLSTILASGWWLNTSM